MSKPKILFVLPPYTPGSAESFLPYLGTAYIQAYLKQQGIESQQFIRPCGTVDQVARDICSYGADFVGFTCYDINYYFVRLLSQAVKKISPSTTIFVGGPTATSSDELIMRDCPFIDACFRGEAEISVFEALSRPPEKWDQVRSLTFRSNGEIIRTEGRDIITSGTRGAELDVLPSPFLLNIIDEKWAESSFTILAPLSSRGCPFNCTYCSFSQVSTKKVRYHSIDRIIAEMEIIQELWKKYAPVDQLGWVEFSDDCFNVNLKRAKQLCQALVSAKIRLPLWADLHAQNIDEELIQLMRQAGFTFFNIGLESGSPGVLRNICKVRSSSMSDKSLKREKTFLSNVRQAVQWAKQEKILVSVSIIQGLPGEQKAEANETMRFLEQLPVDYYHHNYLRIFPGTPLFTEHHKFGIEIEPSETVLPYITRHAYDLGEIPVGKHSDVYNSGMYAAFDFISGIWGTEQDPGHSEGTHFTFLPPIDEWNSRDLEWLGRNTVFFTRVMAASASFSDEHGRRSFLSRMAAHQVPTQHFAFLLPADQEEKKDNQIYDESYRLFIHSLYKPIHVISPMIHRIGFSDLIHSAPSQVPSNQLIVSLPPIKSLEDFSVTGSKMSADDISSVLINKNAMLEDSCKWGPTRCPAAQLQRLIFTKNKGIKTCFSSPELAHIGCNLSSIKDKLVQLMKQEEERRNCRECPVSDTCARCLFPEPFSVEEYCQLKRQSFFAGSEKLTPQHIRFLWWPIGKLEVNKAGEMDPASVFK